MSVYEELLDWQRRTKMEAGGNIAQVMHRYCRFMAGHGVDIFRSTMLSARAAKNVDEEFERNLSWSDKLADSVAALNGSWAFILGLIGLTLLWCGVNVVWSHPADPYPFAFFNLALAILVGLQGPLIVMSQNRQSLKDRARADTDFKVNLKNEVNIETLLRELAEFRAEHKTREQRELERRDWARHERDRVDLD